MVLKRIVARVAAAIIFSTLILSGCGSPVPQKNAREILSGFSVHYVDVTQGDCVFIRLPDGKNVLIDCGKKDQEILDDVTDFLSTYSVNKLDYFILTHPDNDHVGNAKDLIDAYQIGVVYHPHIVDQMLDLFPDYKNAYLLAKDKAEDMLVSDMYDVIKGEDYFLCFLTPQIISKGVYEQLNSTLLPEETLINDLSPIIYLEYKGVSFLFTGDAGNSQEELAIENVNSTSFQNHLKHHGVQFDILGVDFLKVAHHGSRDSTSEQFLNAVLPKNAVISVGSDNPYGHPSSELLERICTVNDSCEIWRTDVYGTISVGVDDSGEVKIITDKK